MDSYEEWLSKDMRGDGDRPEATFVALADGEVAGYAKLSLSKSDSKIAFHDMTGVLRAFRGRGIAAALKRAEIAWAKQAGLREAADGERGAERADPPAQRAPRLQARARARRPRTTRCPGRTDGRRASARAACQRRAFSSRSICRFASRSAIVRRLSPLSLPRPSATSTFTLPSLK